MSKLDDVLYELEMNGWGWKGNAREAIVELADIRRKKEQLEYENKMYRDVLERIAKARVENTPQATLQEIVLAVRETLAAAKGD